MDNIHLTPMGRSMLMDAVVEPNRTDVLPGVLVPERPDLPVHPLNATVYPREKTAAAE